VSPNYISKGGKWYPAKERVGLHNYSGKTIKNPSTDERHKDEEIKPGEAYTYVGADRAALFELWRVKADHFGEDFRQNPEFLQAVRNMGYSSVSKYLKDIGYDEKKMDEEFAKKAEIITTHELPKKVKAIEVLAGGRDTSGGGQDMKGKFDAPPGFEK
jgi:hypothetical protein